jgi:hypothetical protein
VGGLRNSGRERERTHFPQVQVQPSSSVSTRTTQRSLSYAHDIGRSGKLEQGKARREVGGELRRPGDLESRPRPDSRPNSGRLASNTKYPDSTQCLCVSNLTCPSSASISLKAFLTETRNSIPSPLCCSTYIVSLYVFNPKHITEYYSSWNLP